MEENEINEINEISEEPQPEPEPFVIPKIYKYSALTGEYTGQSFADKDPEESKIKGEFVPLIPANATLKEPAEYGENEIPVFDAGEWVTKADYRKNFVIVDENLNFKEITEIGEVEGIKITKEFAEEIKQNPGNYKIEGGEVVKKSDEEIEAEKLAAAKAVKIAENDTARDNALYAGVTYKGVLFDSDTDQKINLLAIVTTMGDEDTVTWFGMNNDALECTKADLSAIGEMITVLHSYCWAKNAEIKHAINEAAAVEAVENIEINYGTENILLSEDEIPF